MKKNKNEEELFGMKKNKKKRLNFCNLLFFYWGGGAETRTFTGNIYVLYF
jgi:hypothetical protein